MVDDFKGPDGVDYSPIDLYAKYSVTPEQVRRGDDNFGAGFPIGARNIPVGTRPCLQGIVCYTSAEGIGDGCQPDALLISFLRHGCRLLFSSKGHMPGQSPPQRYTVSPSRRLRSSGFTPCENLCYNGHNHT